MSTKKWLAVIAVGLGLAFAVALISPLASPHPDGLEKVAEDKGFIEEGKDPSYEIIPGYAFPGVDNENLATILAGVAGVIIVAALGFAYVYGMRAMRSRDTGDSAAAPPGGH